MTGPDTGAGSFFPIVALNLGRFSGGARESRPAREVDRTPGQVSCDPDVSCVRFGSRAGEVHLGSQTRQTQEHGRTWRSDNTRDSAATHGRTSGICATQPYCGSLPCTLSAAHLERVRVADDQ